VVRFTPGQLQCHHSLGLRASGNLPVSYVLTGNLPEIYHIVYFLVISKYIGGDTGAKPYN